MRPMIKVDREITPEQAQQVRDAWAKWQQDPSKPIVLMKGMEIVDLDAPPMRIVVPDYRLLNDKLSELVRWVLVEAVLLTFLIAVLAGTLILRLAQ